MKNQVLILLIALFTACKDQPQPKGILPPADSVLSIVTSDPSSLVVSRQRPVRAGDYSIIQTDENKLTGYSERNPEKDVAVSPLFAGRIEKVFVSSPGERVQKGQVLFNYYSPEMTTLQEQYILAGNQGDDNLKQKIAARLLLLGFPPGKLQQLNGRSGPFMELPYYAPVSGYLFTPDEAGRAQPMQDQVNTGSMSMESTEEGIFSSAAGNNRLPVAEEYFNMGDKLYVINDMSTVWISFYLPPGTSRRSGENITVMPSSGSSMNARIRRTETIVREGSEFVSVRAELNNPDLTLKTGEVVTVLNEKADMGDGVLVPSSAVLDLGNRMMVWKVTASDTSEGVYIYEAFQVTAQQTGSSNLRVTSGLKAGEEIALSAGFMTDVQALIIPEDED